MVLVDSFDWDISNPDNIPEEFAAFLVADLVNNLPCDDKQRELMELEQDVSLEIRRQISTHCMRISADFKANFEAITMSKANQLLANKLRQSD